VEEKSNILDFPKKENPGFELTSEHGEIIYSIDNNFNSDYKKSDIPEATRVFYEAIEKTGKGFLHKISELTKENKLLKETIFILCPDPLNNLPGVYSEKLKDILRGGKE
jgi:hypothetical protein